MEMSEIAVAHALLFGNHMNQEDQKETDSQEMMPKLRESLAHDMEKLLEARRQEALHRYPLLITLSAAFGLVSIFYGFEAIINQLGLEDNPLILLGLGVGILLAAVLLPIYNLAGAL